jgi:hypothetical protein
VPIGGFASSDPQGAPTWADPAVLYDESSAACHQARIDCSQCCMARRLLFVAPMACMTSALRLSTLTLAVRSTAHVAIDGVRRLGLCLALVAGLLPASTQAHAQWQSDLEQAPPAETEPSDSLGVLQLVLGTSYLAAPLLAVALVQDFEGYAALSFTAPIIVHFAYGDLWGGLIALVGYPAAVLGTALIGVAIDRSSCGEGELLCGLGGLVLGGLIGMSVWPFIDVFAITPATYRNRPGAP